MKKLILCFLIAIPMHFSWAEDIELYIGTEEQRIGDQPQVLIIFDTSGSMASTEVVIKSYDPDVIYPNSNGYVYYSYDANVPSLDSSSRFLASDNGCNTSKSVLDTNGFYLGRASYYIPQGSGESARWSNLSGTISGDSGHFIDCQDDVTNNDLKNADGVIDGLPSNDNATIDNPPPYAISPSSFPSFNRGIRFFSSNYVAWFNAPEEILKTRLEIAQETVVSLVESAPGVVFGLEVFNANVNVTTSGGRIAYGIRDEADYDSNELLDIVKNELRADGRTPLCESLYEASRYLGGKGVEYGNGGFNRTPGKDISIVNDDIYISPYARCTDEVFVILITDGQPVDDSDADHLVDALNPGGTGNRLDELAEWMHTNDINDSLEGTQIATTYTIGFGQSAVTQAGALLNSAANKGGGTYFPASNANDLLTALNNTLLDILEVSTSFTSPSVASNNFDRTETLDSIYYSMFLPSEGARWSGNLKKLRVSGSQQLDRTGAIAVNSEGNILNSAKTFWTTNAEADGPNVTEGGIAEVLRNKTDRNLLSNLGASDALVEFSYSNAVAKSGNDATLAVDMGTDESQLQNHFLWASGIDVDDEDEDGQTGDNRQDIFGDPLHSRPLVINYGGTPQNQDIRIVVGTNAGFIHMFKDQGNTVDETWAFMPKELFDNIPVLRTNSSNANKVYGIDSSPTVHTIDHNGDGTINTSEGDKVWLYFGLRRGGRSYYAIDISNPDVPKFMWHINDQSPGFNELAQTWSEFKVAFSKLNVDNGVAKPVAFFSAGYDTNKDSNTLGTSDSIGRGIYMVDAESGTLLFSATPFTTSGNNLQWSELTDSIPASLATLDSDSDGFVDRLYASDTGGNVWRIDMPGDSPNSTDSPWTIHKLATLGDDADILNDRRFFYQPTIARAIITDTVQTNTTIDGLEQIITTRFDQRYDAILLGSGDRTSPTSTDTDDKFFMIKDPDIITRSFGVDGHVIPPVITVTDLFDFTDNPYGETLSTQALETLDLAVSSASGWRIDYTGAGEKSVSSGVVILGVAYFTSFTPAELTSDGVCAINSGVGRLYAVDLARGSNIYNFRSLEVGERVLDTPTIIIPPGQPTEDTNLDGIIDTNDRATNGVIRIVGAGADTNNDDSSIAVCSSAENCDGANGDGSGLSTERTYLYVTEE